MIIRFNLAFLRFVFDVLAVACFALGVIGWTRWFSVYLLVLGLVLWTLGWGIQEYLIRLVKNDREPE